MRMRFRKTAYWTRCRFCLQCRIDCQHDIAISRHVPTLRSLIQRFHIPLLERDKEAHTFTLPHYRTIGLPQSAHV